LESGASMERQYLTANHKLIQAVRALATGPEDMRGRLPRVYFLLDDLTPDDLPDALRDDFKWMMDKLTAREPRWTGPVFWETPAQASVAAMRNKTAVRIAEAIFYISDRLRDIVTGY
jgi:hypothetical protein